MRVRGCVKLSDMEQSRLEHGMLIDFPPARVYSLAKTFSVGDLFWVKENFVIITSSKAWLQGAYRIFPGPRRSFDHIPKDFRSTDYKMAFRDADHLARSDSRATAEILSVADGGRIHCVIHMQQIDQMLKARAA